MSDRTQGSVRAGSGSTDVAAPDGTAPGEAPDTGVPVTATQAIPTTGTQRAQAPATGNRPAGAAAAKSPTAAQGPVGQAATGGKVAAAANAPAAAKSPAAGNAPGAGGPSGAGTAAAGVVGATAAGAPAAGAPVAGPPAAGSPAATGGPAVGQPAGGPPGAPPVPPATGASPAVAPGTAKAAATADAADEAGRGPRGRRPARGSRGPRRARLQLRHIDTWSALKISLVLSIALFFIWMVAVGVLYGVLNALDVFDTLNDLFGQIGSASGSESGGDVVTPGLVFGGAAIIGAINIVLLTALCTVGTFIYNLCSDLVGGLELTLSERD
jgi:hypothetical protein